MGEGELRTGPSRVVGIAAVVVPVVLAAIMACTSTGGGDRAAEPGDDETEVDDFEMQADDFVALEDMTRVRGFFIDNHRDRLDEAVAVAENPEGGVYPVGTVIQLVPQEAMVKRAPGFDPASNDWEFFNLEVSEEGTTILTRGGSEVVNQFGGMSCVECHSLAEPQFDFICESDNGCDPLPVGDDVIQAVQEADPRPRLPAG